ncbi:tRNA (adenosine(37)-N6)-threonylcarbamoyltransferase complex transferase subunit TsaD [Patescibacteria group bacterium]
MKILAIETSCDETAAAVTEGRRILSNVIFSQVNIHKKYGGVYPTLAKRAHLEKIDLIINKALKIARVSWSDLGAITVTFGPGLVVALEVGVNRAKELAQRYKKPVIPVNHLEGHFYSAFAQNGRGNPVRDFIFPCLFLIASGGHTSLILVKGHLDYQILGQTLDDAAGEALDKAAKMMNLGYPGGPIIEKLAQEGKLDSFDLPVPMLRHPGLNFSYSGLKTAFKYQLEKMGKGEIFASLPDLASSFQEATFKAILAKTKRALSNIEVKCLVVGGGVLANKLLRKKLRRLVKDQEVTIYFPSFKKLTGDNAAMIGVAAFYKYQQGIYLKKNFDKLDRVARPDLNLWTKKLKK